MKCFAFHSIDWTNARKAPPAKKKNFADYEQVAGDKKSIGKSIVATKKVVNHFWKFERCRKRARIANERIKNEDDKNGLDPMHCLSHGLNLLLQSFQAISFFLSLFTFFIVSKRKNDTKQKERQEADEGNEEKEVKEEKKRKNGKRWWWLL